MVGLAALDPPYTSTLRPAFRFAWPILALEIGRPLRYIRRCTFVRVCSLTFRQTFDRRCPVWHRRAAVSAPGATAGLSSSAENCPVPCGQRGVWGRLARVSSHDSRSCSHPTLLDKPAVAPGGNRWLARFWACLLEPCRGPRRFVRHKPLYRKHLQRPIFCFALKRLQDNGLRPKKPFGGHCVLWGECELQSLAE